MQQTVGLGTVVTHAATRSPFNLDQGCLAPGVAFGDVHTRCFDVHADCLTLRPH